MSLENLSKIRLLEAHKTDAKQLGKLLLSVESSILDSLETTISNQTRMNAAYLAITQLCMAALWANGYRPSRNRPGHHQTMIQSLVHTVGLDADRVRLLDTFRVKRNAIDYTGDDVDPASVDACVEAVHDLRDHVMAWLRVNCPELID